MLRLAGTSVKFNNKNNKNNINDSNVTNIDSIINNYNYSDIDKINKFNESDKMYQSDFNHNEFIKEENNKSKLNQSDFNYNYILSKSNKKNNELKESKSNENNKIGKIMTNNNLIKKMEDNKYKEKEDTINKIYKIDKIDKSVQSTNTLSVKDAEVMTDIKDIDPKNSNIDELSKNKDIESLLTKIKEEQYKVVNAKKIEQEKLQEQIIMNEKNKYIEYEKKFRALTSGYRINDFKVHDNLNKYEYDRKVHFVETKDNIKKDDINEEDIKEETITTRGNIIENEQIESTPNLNIRSVRAQLIDRYSDKKLNNLNKILISDKVVVNNKIIKNNRTSIQNNKFNKPNENNYNIIYVNNKTDNNKSDILKKSDKHISFSDEFKNVNKSVQNNLQKDKKSDIDYDELINFDTPIFYDGLRKDKKKKKKVKKINPTVELDKILNSEFTPLDYSDMNPELKLDISKEINVIENIINDNTKSTELSESAFKKLESLTNIAIENKEVPKYNIKKSFYFS